MIRRYKIRKISSFIILIIVMLSITIGYSVLSSTLNIMGTTNIIKPTWDIRFANIAVTSGSVTSSHTPTISADGLHITYSVTLANPGDFYEFTFEVWNYGTIDAKLSAAPTVAGVSSAQDVYVNYTFTHADGTAVLANETIPYDSCDQYKVRVEFDNTINANQLPTSTQGLTLTVGMNFVQA